MEGGTNSLSHPCYRADVSFKAFCLSSDKNEEKKMREVTFVCEDGQDNI